MMIRISHRDWVDDTHKVLSQDVLHEPQGQNVMRCAKCGLPFDGFTRRHVSKYAPEVAKELKITFLAADYLIEAGKFTDKK